MNVLIIPLLLNDHLYYCEIEKRIFQLKYYYRADRFILQVIEPIHHNHNYTVRETCSLSKYR